MSNRISLSLVAAFAAMAVAAPLHAQMRSTIDASALDATVASRPDRSRALVTSTLTSNTALGIAASMGLSAENVSTRIAALDDASARKVADQMLAGGDQMVVISTTAIIIGLLILILLTR